MALPRESHSKWIRPKNKSFHGNAVTGIYLSCMFLLIGSCCCIFSFFHFSFVAFSSIFLIDFDRILRLRFQSMCKEYHRHKLVKQAFHHWQNRLMNRRADRRYNGGLQRWFLWRDYLVTFSARVFLPLPRAFSSRVWSAEMLHFFAFAEKFSSCGFYDTRGMWSIVIFLRLWLER